MEKFVSLFSKNNSFVILLSYPCFTIRSNAKYKYSGFPVAKLTEYISTKATELKTLFHSNCKTDPDRKSTKNPAVKFRMTKNPRKIKFSITFESVKAIKDPR